MANRNQSADHAQDGHGTTTKSLTPRETTATPPISNGPSGEKAEQGNRNKKS